jgi:hypothetical protein
MFTEEAMLYGTKKIQRIILKHTAGSLNSGAENWDYRRLEILGFGRHFSLGWNVSSFYFGD